MPTTTRKVISATFRALANGGTAYSAAALSSAMAGEKPPFPPVDHDDPRRFAADYLAYNLVRKDEDGIFAKPVSDHALIEKAVFGFLEVEQRLSYINRRGYIPGTAPTSDMLAPEPVLHLARRKIEQLLGNFSPDEMVEASAFSAGASTRLPRKRGMPYFKFTGKPHVTRNCALLAVCALWHSPIWRSYCQMKYGRDSDPQTWITVVRGSEYFTVPKTFDTKRGAAKEPCFNMYLQKGIGAMIRKRLKSVRIDLDDQTYNQYLARCGSGTGSLATIDLAAASDSVSLTLLDLLPGDWKRFILLTRSEEILLPSGQWHTLQKVSSMGNGFTFELESLLFWALTSACVDLKNVQDRRIGVYGDDIICHHSVAPDIINVLAYCGFETNVDKTFVSGPFRESCGKHYFYGVDVSPFNVKKLLDTDSEKYHFLNRLRLWAFRNDALYLQDTYKYIIRAILPKKVNVVPPSFGTRAGMLVPNVASAAPYISAEPKPRRNTQPWYQGWSGWALVASSHRVKKSGFPAYCAWWNTRIGEVFVTDQTKESTEFRPRRFSVSEWSDCEIGLLETLIPLRVVS